VLHNSIWGVLSLFGGLNPHHHAHGNGTVRTTALEDKPKIVLNLVKNIIFYLQTKKSVNIFDKYSQQNVATLYPWCNAIACRRIY